MNTLVLCDKEGADFCGQSLAARIETLVRSAGGDVKTVMLDGDAIEPCVGCLGCWVKTPGLCVMTRDGVNEIAGREIRADVVVLVSRMTYGGYSHDIKAFLDRSIPNILPLFEIYRGEMHHKPRYERFPCLISVMYGEATPKELQTFASLAERNALNMRPPKHFVFACQDAGEMEQAMRALEKVLSAQVPS